MELGHFDGYFHLFSAANLGWAGSETFREAIDDSIFKSVSDADNEINANIKYINENIENIKVDPKYHNAIKNSTITIKKNFDIKLAKITEDSKKDFEFVEGVKSMFLITSLFSIAILVISGYQQYFEEENNLFILLASINMCILYNIYIFYRSFTGKFNTRISTLRIFIFILVVFGIFLFASTLISIDKEYTSTCIKMSITLSLVTALSPFVLHFIKVYMHNRIFKQKISILSIKTKIELENVLSDGKGLLKIFLQENLNDIGDNSPIQESFYLSTPNTDGSFENKDVSQFFREGVSIYRFVKSSNYRAEFFIEDKEDSVRRALQYPDKQIDPVCEAINAFNPNAKKIKTITPGEVELIGSQWVVSYNRKAKIRYE